MRKCEHCSPEEPKPENCWCPGISSVLLLLLCVWAYQQPCWNTWVSQIFHSFSLFTPRTNPSDLSYICFFFSLSFRNLLALHRMATLHRDELGQVMLIFCSPLIYFYVVKFCIPDCMYLVLDCRKHCSISSSAITSTTTCMIRQKSFDQRHLVLKHIPINK